MSLFVEQTVSLCPTALLYLQPKMRQLLIEMVLGIQRGGIILNKHGL